MNAIEFVKKYGIQIAIDALHDMPKDWGGCYLRDRDFEFIKSPSSVDDCICMGEIHKVVEAFEFVESYGGLDNSRLKLNELADGVYDCAPLIKAINLVEQCL